jgi:hypothetical protein
MQNRNINDLKEPFKNRFKWFMEEWNKWNPTLEIFLVEWLRDLATQKEYVKKWVSKTLKSNHLTGQAGDIAFKDPKNWLYLEKRKDSEFIRKKLVELWHKYHLANGYYTLNRWFDKPHFQNVELQKPYGKITNYNYAIQWVAKFTS